MSHKCLQSNLVWNSDTSNWIQFLKPMQSEIWKNKTKHQNQKEYILKPLSPWKTGDLRCWVLLYGEDKWAVIRPLRSPEAVNLKKSTSSGQIKVLKRKCYLSILEQTLKRCLWGLWIYFPSIINRSNFLSFQSKDGFSNQDLKTSCVLLLFYVSLSHWLRFFDMNLVHPEIQST